jgi:hypothetical protein
MLGDDPDSCDQTVPPPVVIDTDHAVKLVEISLTHPQGIYRPGDRIAMWRTPTTRGDTCFFIGLADVRPTPPGGANPTGGGTCGSATWPSTSAIQVGASKGLAGDRYTVLVIGRVKPGSGIVRVELESADGHIAQTAFGNDAFLAELPDAPRAGKGPGPIPGGPYTAVGYDADHNKVASTPVPGSG